MSNETTPERLISRARGGDVPALGRLLELYRNYTDQNFAPHKHYPLAQLHRSPSGDVETVRSDRLTNQGVEHRPSP